MIEETIKDYRQQKALRKKLDEGSMSRKLSLKSLYYCGRKVNFSFPGVAVAVNKNDAQFFGTATCKSPWCCPNCTARQMAKYATDIAVAIDALKKQNQFAAMITFTIPHTSDFSCLESTEILYNTWKAFTVHGNKVLASAKNDVFSNFAAAFNHKHRIRVAEYTYGNHGWHPHFHTLFWFPAEKFQDILQWEERLKARWYEIAKRETVKQLMKRYPSKYFSKDELKDLKKKTQKRIEIMYSKLDENSHGVFISKKDDKVIRQESSNYICGWGANREITGNYQEKATAEGHFTWQQILKLAVDYDEAHPKEKQENKWWTLYFEYALATRKFRHARINFSVHSGLKQIIADYKKTEAYKTFLKKNSTNMVQKNGCWKILCWFTPSQWLEICSQNLQEQILFVYFVYMIQCLSF